MENVGVAKYLNDMPLYPLIKLVLNFLVFYPQPDWVNLISAHPLSVFPSNVKATHRLWLVKTIYKIMVL